jgi:hypothetical protein
MAHHMDRTLELHLNPTIVALSATSKPANGYDARNATRDSRPVLLNREV